jgi:hypothetical protein
VSTYVAEVSSDLHSVSGGEFPRPMGYEVFWVQVTNAQGRRLRHEQSFPAAKPYRCPEDGWTKLEHLPGAVQEAQRLADRVNQASSAGLALEPARWREIDPAYGSAQYMSEGIEEQRWQRERDAHA